MSHVAGFASSFLSAVVNFISMDLCPIIENLEKQLFEMQDLKYRDFHSKLLPGIDRETIIGIRTPMLRKFTKEFAETLEAELFLKGSATPIL